MTQPDRDPTDRARRTFVRVVFTIAMIVIALLALIGGLITAAIIYFAVYFNSGPDYTAPTPEGSPEEARQAVAQELCPRDPASVINDLTVDVAHSDYLVRLRSRPEITQPQGIESSADFAATFLVDSSHFVFAADIEVAEFAAYLRATCPDPPATSDWRTR